MKIKGTVGFIGAGKMATAIASGLLKNGWDKNKLGAYDVSVRAGAQFAAKTGIKTASSLAAVTGAEAIIIAVKPQNLRDALENTAGLIADKLLISIVAGIKIESLKKFSGAKRLVRVMPNTPALIGEGMSAYCTSSGVTARDRRTAEAILGAIGLVVKVEEKQMDVVTGLSGSGPAYVFDFIQALADGGVNGGLSRELALKLAVQTVSGAARLVQVTGEHPGVLKDMVTSPGGTTSRGLAVLEDGAFRGLVAAAVLAAAERAEELGRK
jgi:pyrroline-5-carboxylate reductase